MSKKIAKVDKTSDSKKPINWKREILSWIVTFLVAVILVVFITQVLIVNAEIPSESMENTIMTHDRLIANRLSYKFDDPKRGDIIVFKLPDDETQLYIKRIIGLPGETIEGKDGVVYIDDKPLKEDYIKEPAEDDFGPYTVPDECYFMMGDNRNNSLDSRYWDKTFLHREKILGKAVFEYYPKFKKMN